MKAKNWYFKYLLGGIVIFVVTVSVVALVVLSSLPDAWRVLLGLIPAALITYAGTSIARTIGEMDELQQRIHLEALVFSLAGVVLLSFALGLLQAIFIPMIELGLISVLPMSVGFWAIGLVVARRRYQYDFSFR
jgi:hypothetical protein